jgi:hypothetical protein
MRQAADQRPAMPISVPKIHESTQPVSKMTLGPTLQTAEFQDKGSGQNLGRKLRKRPH